MNVIKWVIVVLAAYFLGCFQTGVVVSRAKNVDIRQHGSKSTGTTNMFRVLGAKASAITFVGDFLKGTLAVLIGHLLLGTEGASVAGVLVVIGHMLPVTAGFKGGKGVATSIGTSVILNPVLGLGLMLAGIVGVAITHVVSIFSILGLIAFGIINPFFCGGNVFEIAYSIILALLVTWAHRSNIKRLLTGTENKLDFSRKDSKKVK